MENQTERQQFQAARVGGEKQLKRWHHGTWKKNLTQRSGQRGSPTRKNFWRAMLSSGIEVSCMKMCEGIRGNFVLMTFQFPMEIVTQSTACWTFPMATVSVSSSTSTGLTYPKTHRSSFTSMAASGREWISTPRPMQWSLLWKTKRKSSSSITTCARTWHSKPSSGSSRVQSRTYSATPTSTRRRASRLSVIWAAHILSRISLPMKWLSGSATNSNCCETFIWFQACTM